MIVNPGTPGRGKSKTGIMKTEIKNTTHALAILARDCTINSGRACYRGLPFDKRSLLFALIFRPVNGIVLSFHTS